VGQVGRVSGDWGSSGLLRSAPAGTRGDQIAHGLGRSALVKTESGGAPMARQRTGFTLTELLVVIAII